MNQPHTVSLDINGQPLSIETGKVAKQADGAVVVRYGGSMVLATCVASKTAREGQDFLAADLIDGRDPDSARHHEVERVGRISLAKELLVAIHTTLAKRPGHLL